MMGRALSLHQMDPGSHPEPTPLSPGWRHRQGPYSASASPAFCRVGQRGLWSQPARFISHLRGSWVP